VMRMGIFILLRLLVRDFLSYTDHSIYLDITDPDIPTHTLLKVGRTVNLTRRINQWSKQCRSKDQILRGWWPNGLSEDVGSFMKGRVEAGDKGRWCHRLERLVHIELRDLAENAPYLDPDFPNSKLAENDTGSRKKRSGKSGKKTDSERCPDCESFCL